MVMNKTELIEHIAFLTEIGKADVSEVVNTLFREIAVEIQGGGKVSVYGFGTFFVKDMKQRTGRNPKTNEQVLIPARKCPAFKPSPVFKMSMRNN